MTKAAMTRTKLTVRLIRMSVIVKLFSNVVFFFFNCEYIPTKSDFPNKVKSVNDHARCPLVDIYGGRTTSAVG